MVRQAHHEAASSIVVDSLTPYYTLDEPYTSRMAEGGVKVAFLSVASDADWETMLARTETALAKIARNPLLAHAASAAEAEAAVARGRIAMVLVTQSAEMIGKDLARVGLMHRFGYRVLGLCYTFANLYGDGCGERRDAGLTFLGRELIDAVNELPMMLDLSHAGHRTSHEAALRARRPVVTHANAYAIAANDRNKKDETLRLIAAKGGVIGACALPRSVDPEDPTLERLLDHVDYMIGLVGSDHVGLGLDFTEGYQEAGHILPQSRRNRTLRPDIFGTVDDFLNQRYPSGIDSIRLLPNVGRAMLARDRAPAEVSSVLGRSWLDALRRVAG